MSLLFCVTVELSLFSHASAAFRCPIVIRVLSIDKERVEAPNKFTAISDVSASGYDSGTQVS